MVRVDVQPLASSSAPGSSAASSVRRLRSRGVVPAEADGDGRSSSSTSARPASAPRSSTSDLAIRRWPRRPFPPSTPFPGLVEFDAAELVPARARRRRRGRSPRPASRSPPSASRTSGPARSCGTARTGEPIAPALGWQDLRTVGECIMAKAEHGLALAPNQSATKLAWLLANVDRRTRSRPLLRHGRHVAGVVAVRRRAPRHRPHQRRRHRPAWRLDGSAWNERVLELLGVPPALLPRLVDSSGVVGDGDRAARRAADRRARRRPAGVARRPGLRHARAGQDHVRHRRHARRLPRAPRAPASARRGEHGTFPIVAWSRGGEADVGCRGDHAVRRHEHRVAARRPRPHRHERREPRRGGVGGRRRDGVVLRAGAARARHAAAGTTARAARCSASPAARHGPTSCGPCWKASPTAAPTSSRPPRPTPG